MLLGDCMETCKKMKKILLYSPDTTDEKIFTRSVRDNANDPFIFLKDKLCSLGYELKIAGDNSLENCEWVVFMDSPFPPSNWRYKLKNFIKNKTISRNLYKECLDKGMRDKMALFLWEGVSVKPNNYLKSVYDKFSIIFTWNDDLVDNKKFFKFYLPIPGDAGTHPKIPFNKRKLLINISRNKKSPHPRELYTARKKSIRYFNKNFLDDFDLYGVGWNKPISRMEKIFPWLVEKFSAYRGVIDNKIEKLPYYKFSLCYENLKGEKGYITDKIFDPMRSNTVPIYWGASNITDYIPRDSFIDRRNFKSDKELVQFIENINENEHNEHLKAIDAFLKSDKFRVFLPENFADTIIKTLNLKNIL